MRIVDTLTGSDGRTLPGLETLGEGKIWPPKWGCDSQCCLGEECACPRLGDRDGNPMYFRDGTPRNKCWLNRKLCKHHHESWVRRKYRDYVSRVKPISERNLALLTLTTKKVNELPLNPFADLRADLRYLFEDEFMARKLALLLARFAISGGNKTGWLLHIHALVFSREGLSPGSAKEHELGSQIRSTWESLTGANQVTLESCFGRKNSFGEIKGSPGAIGYMLKMDEVKRGEVDEQIYESRMDGAHRTQVYDVRIRNLYEELGLDVSTAAQKRTGHSGYEQQRTRLLEAVKAVVHEQGSIAQDGSYELCMSINDMAERAGESPYTLGDRHRRGDLPGIDTELSERQKMLWKIYD